MDGMLSSVLSGRVFNLSLVAAFAVVALLLTTIGIYALVAYMVSQRVPEIGIRTALGARSSQIIWLFIRRSAFLVALGIGVGLASSTGATRVLAGLLFEVPPVDPLSYATGIVALVVPALLAGLLSSRRASRIDPLVALRNH
jgi:ABC-type antimicrobial peptide transport system permease subunit